MSHSVTVSFVGAAVGDTVGAGETVGALVGSWADARERRRNRRTKGDIDLGRGILGGPTRGEGEMW